MTTSLFRAAKGGQFIPFCTFLKLGAGYDGKRAARKQKAQARRAFDQRNMSYNVALALLEEAVLLLEEGRVAEVKVLARELEKVFNSKGVHREALGALRLVSVDPVRVKPGPKDGGP